MYVGQTIDYPTYEGNNDSGHGGGGYQCYNINFATNVPGAATVVAMPQPIPAKGICGTVNAPFSWEVTGNYPTAGIGEYNANTNFTITICPVNGNPCGLGYWHYSNCVCVTVVSGSQQPPPVPERPCPDPLHRCNPQAGRPVDIADGEEVYEYADLALSGPFGLSFSRTYANQTVGMNDLGAHWQHNYDARLDVSGLSHGSVTAYDATGLPTFFVGVAAGTSVYDAITATTLTLDPTGTTYTLASFSNQRWTYNAKGELIGETDRHGNQQTIARDSTPGNGDRILSVSDPLGHQLCFYYDSSNRIQTLAWLASGACPASVPSSVAVVKLTYDSGAACAKGQLCSVTEPDGATWTYQYQNDGTIYANNLTEVVDPMGDPEKINTYQGNQVAHQQSGKCASGSTCADTGDDLSFSYPSFGTTVVTDALGRATTYTMDPVSFMLKKVSGPLCKCGGDQTRQYYYDAADRLVYVYDDGDGTKQHYVFYQYQRDTLTTSYPGPTSITENIDTNDDLRITTMAYYPIGDPRQDLVETTTLPSVDTPGQTMTITDTYDTGGDLTTRSKVGYVNGIQTTYAWNYGYDSRGRLQTATGPRTDVAQTTKYLYFPDTDNDRIRAGQLETITDALNHTTQYASAAAPYSSYTIFGRPLSMTDPNGVVTQYAYDPRGRLLTNTLVGTPGKPTNYVTTTKYDLAGRVTSIKRPLSNGVAVSYDTSSRVTGLTRFDASGLQHERLVMSYDNNDELSSRVAQKCTSPATTCAAGSWSTTFSQTYAYDPLANLLKIINADGTYQQFGYEPQGPLATFSDENHANTSDVTYKYDLAGRRLSEVHVLAGTAAGVTTSYGYDLHDNMANEIDPNGNMTTYHYDDFDRVASETSPVKGVTTYSYDPADNLVSTQRADLNFTNYKYDPLNRTTVETADVDNDADGSFMESSSFTYDDPTPGNFGIGRLTGITDGPGSASYVYDVRGLLESESRITGENGSTAKNQFATSYRYDANGNRQELAYPDGKIVSYGYDYADRPNSAQQTTTLNAAALTIQPPGLRAAFITRSTGVLRKQVVKGEKAVKVVHFRPQPAGLVRATQAAATQQSAGAVTPRVLRGSLVIGSRASLEPVIVNSQNVARQNTRSSRRRVAALPGASATSYVTAATYAPFGPLTSITYGNGIIQNLGYTQRYLPSTNTLTAGSTPLSSYTYGEDAAGNIQQITDALSLNHAYDRSFKYDDLNRLVTANSGASLWGNGGYSYDAMGNIQRITLGSTTRAFTYYPGAGNGGNPNSVIPEVSTATENGVQTAISYDVDGNEYGGGAENMSYSANELPAATYGQGGALSGPAIVQAYYYDAFHRRIQTQLANQSLRDSFFDPEQHLISETPQFSPGAVPGVPYYDYIWFGDRPVAQVDSTGTHWTYGDYLGTPLIQTDINANVTWQAEYEPYGSIYALRAGDVHQPLRLPGQSAEQFDMGANGLTPLSYNNARWYQPTWGRYSQPDPIGLKGASVNLYTYGAENPLKNQDTLGENWFTSVGDVANLFSNWVTGSGPELETFGPGSDAANDMQSSLGVKEMLAAYCQKKAQCPAANSYTNFAYSFLRHWGPLTSGFNPTQQFVGSYNGDVYDAGAGNVMIVITNTTSLPSFLYDLPFVPEYRRSQFGPGGNTTQLIEWIQPAGCSKP